VQYTADNILVKPGVFPDDPDLILSITPEQAGWEYISFQARRLAANQNWSFASGENELVIVNLSGRYNVRSNWGQWSGIGTRKDVLKAQLTHCISPGTASLLLRLKKVVSMP